MMDAEDLDFVCPHRICHKRQTGMAHTIANLSSDIELLRKNPPMTLAAKPVAPVYVLHPKQLEEYLRKVTEEINVAMHRDAERYRWLRKQNSHTGVGWSVVDDSTAVVYEGETLDAEIDLAMRLDGDRTP